MKGREFGGDWLEHSRGGFSVWRLDGSRAEAKRPRPELPFICNSHWRLLPPGYFLFAVQFYFLNHLPIMASLGKRQKTVVVGAGPVGALAAIYAAQRGHDVEIYELRSGTLTIAVCCLAFAFRKYARVLAVYTCFALVYCTCFWSLGKYQTCRQILSLQRGGMEGHETSQKFLFALPGQIL